jgi:hypothetical protein
LIVRAAVTVASCFTALGSFAADGTPSEVFHVDDPSRWGRPKQIVVPDYPKPLLDRRHTGYVDFEGSVNALHAMEAIDYQPDSPASEPFVTALMEVMPHWAFYPNIDPNCQPAPTRVKNRVWFELEGDKPKISVTRVSPVAPVPRSTMKATFRRDPRYPYSMLARGLQAYVYAAMAVDPSGKVTQVTSTAFPRSDADLSGFVDETRRALSLWEFTPADAGDGRPRTACVEIFFRIRN